MKRLFVILVFLLLPVLAGWSAVGHSANAGFDAANRLYDQGKYSEAAAEYQKLIQSGAGTAAVYFNFGNALLKSGQIGRAVAVYRTLESSTPRDPDLAANLKFAISQVKGPAFKPDRFRQSLKKVTLNEWTLAVAACFWGTLCLLALSKLRPNLYRTLRLYTLLAGAATVLLATCLVLAVRQASTPTAIVIAREAQVRQAPLEETPPVFNVYDGAELLVLDRNQDWLQVSADARRTGWVQKNHVLTTTP